MPISIVSLREKYEEKGLSMREIARQLGVAKTTVRKHLIKNNITLKTSSKAKRSEKYMYGKKIIKGEVVSHKQEQRVIDSILKMKSEGLSYRAIARILNEMKVKTKTQGKKWHMETVRQIILKQK